MEMKITKEQIKIQINRKVIKPLRNGNKHNVSILNNNNYDIPRETINLLNQCYCTLKNANVLLRKRHLVDANALLRTAFENLYTAMVIMFDKDTCEEFRNLNINNETRDKTRQQALRNEFKKHLNDISYELFFDMGRKDKNKMIEELYDKLCNFTHSTLIVSVMIDAKKNNDDEVLILCNYQNVFFVEMLLFCSLKYITKDNKYILELDNVFISFMLSPIFFNQNKMKKENFDKYNDYLYMNNNSDFFDKQKEDAEKLTNEFNELKNVIAENPDKFKEILIKFLSN